MQHELTIDQTRCHGKEICHACEQIAPGILAYIQKNKKILISPWALRENSRKISQLAVACRQRAIMLKPIG